MKLACFFWMIEMMAREKRTTVAEEMKNAADMGICAVQIGSDAIGKYGICELKGLLDGAGMKLCCLHHGASLVVTEGEEYDAEMKKALDAALAAKELGAEYFMIIPEQSRKITAYPGASDASGTREKMRRCLADLMSLIRKNVPGLCVTLENFSNSLLPFAKREDMEFIHDNTDCTVTLDAGNFLCIREDVTDSAKEFLASGRKYGFVHFKDWKLAEDEREKGVFVCSDGRRLCDADAGKFGTSLVDLREVSKLLISSGYDGYIVIEQNLDCEATEKFADAIEKTKSYLNLY